MPELHDYLGAITLDVDDYFSSINFNILNDGFFKFLLSFKNLLILRKMIQDLITIPLTICHIILTLNQKELNN